MGETTIGVDPFRYLYNEQRDKLLHKGEAEQTDLTEVLYLFLDDKIKNGELINVTCRGEVATGKSTVAIALMYYTNKVLEKTFKKGKDNKDYFTNKIFADQTEFLRFIKKDEKNVAIVIDEYNHLAEGGINSTTEQSLFDQVSDVFAQRYVHRFNCSPSTVLDKNSLVILDVIGKDLKKGITRVRVNYREPTSFDITTLGYADINVKPVLKQVFYKKYVDKKFRRMDLIRKEGVRDIRELEFAGFVMKTYSYLKAIAVNSRVTQSLIQATAQRFVRQDGRIYSIVANLEITNRAYALLNLTYELNKQNERLEKIRRKGGDLKSIKVAIDKTSIILGQSIKEEKKLAKLYVKYLNIK